MLGFEGATKIKKEDGTRADLEYAIAMLDADGNEKVSWGEFREAFLGPLTEEPEDPFEEYLNDYEAYLAVWKSTSVSGARQFFTKSFLGDDAADLSRSSGEEPASPRHRAGVASMAWRTTRRFSTNAP